jgi:hypothetical protein
MGGWRGLLNVIFVKRMKPEGIMGGLIGGRDTLVILLVRSLIEAKRYREAAATLK